MKLQIDRSSLVALGDALRVHFGDTKTVAGVEQEGTREYFTEAPFQAQLGEITRQGEIKMWQIDDVTDGEAPGVGQFDKYRTHTFYIPEAAYVVLDITYETQTYITANTETLQRDYVWVASGRHSNLDDTIGKKLNYTVSNMLNNHEYWYTCESCGYQQPWNGVFHPAEEEIKEAWPAYVTASDRICPSCLPLNLNEVLGLSPRGIMHLEYNDWKRQQTTLTPNEFTIGYGYDEHAKGTYTTGSHYGEDIREWFNDAYFGGSGGLDVPADDITFSNAHWGYYCDIYPYDADGNLLTSFEVIIDEMPQQFSVKEMANAISKLNNYPNGEEEHF